jgi:ABC-type microcin C transport system duplicated ATPase subunit YejF
MKTINKIQTAAAGFVVERGDARWILVNPKEARTQTLPEKVL